MMNSYILNTIRLQDDFSRLVDLQPGLLTLIYRGSKDGFSVDDFHQKMGDTINNLTLIRSDVGDIFGGFTKLSWEKPQGSYHDSQSFIFSLVNNEKKPYKAVASCKTDSICISRDTCIIFGVCNDDDRGHDLILEGNSNNWKETGYWPSSCINRSHNSFICPEQQLALAGCNDRYLDDNFKTHSITLFQTDEIEIFQLINLKRKNY